jgi:isoleucyl-tRNA synthetase
MIQVTVTRTSYHKCGRCRRHRPEVIADGELCDRCDLVLKKMNDEN